MGSQGESRGVKVSQGDPRGVLGGLGGVKVIPWGAIRDKQS